MSVMRSAVELNCEVDISITNACGKQTKTNDDAEMQKAFGLPTLHAVTSASRRSYSAYTVVTL